MLNYDGRAHVAGGYEHNGGCAGRRCGKFSAG